MNHRLSKLFRYAFLALFLALPIGGTIYWFIAVHPFLHVANARLAAPFLEIRSDQAGRLTFAPYQEGDWVKQGDILFSLGTVEERQRQKQLQTSVDSLEKTLSYYSAAVEKATEDYIAARRNSAFDITSGEGAEQLLTILQHEQQLANECKQELAALEANFEQANQTIRQKSMAAPFSGMIVKRQKREGDLVAFGDMIYSLCDPHDVWVDARIEEKHVGKIAVGQKAYIFLPTDKNREWEGAIAWISPVALPSKEGVEVRISLNKKEGCRFLPNLSADVKIKVN
jgi:multidrug resistance efflux pump